MEIRDLVKLKFSFVFLFFLSSCGLKVSQEVSDNVLLGEWSLDKVQCGDEFDLTVETELYYFESNSIDVGLTFDGSRLSYKSIGDCTTTSTGIYKTDFNGTSKGVVDFYDIITGGTTCFETINEIKTGTDQSVRTTLDGTFSEDMDWKVSEDRSTLYLTYPNGLEGSSETTGCALSCYCRAKFDRVD